MASITPKKVAGRTYYYARRCQRVDGKPKIVWQKYLGSAEKLIAMVEKGQSTAAPQLPTPVEALILDFGAVMALFDLAQRLRLTETIDRHVPKRGHGPSVGTYLLVAILNRCVQPCSKAAIGAWFENTALNRLLDVQPQQLTSQRFWDNMNRVSREAIERIEAEVVQTLVREFHVDLREVIFDATNFFTFIDSFNPRCTLAKRGKSKQQRASLRLVGLALLVSSDFHLPLLHRTYPGNQPDSVTFSSLIGDLVDRCRALTDGALSVTLILDKGNNSQDNFAELGQSPVHFVGSLVPSQHPDLLDISLRRFHSLEDEGIEGVYTFRTTRHLFGVDRTVVVTFNENLFFAQTDTLLREIAKRRQCLQTLQRKLLRRAKGQVKGGRPPTLQGVQRQIDKLLKARHMEQLFHIELTEHDAMPKLRYRFDQTAWTRLQGTLLGKSLLFTDREDFSDAEIVRAYRSQSHIEDAFRTMKDPHHIALRPQYHWTDQKIEVHVFYCVLALMLVSLLQREVHARGLGGSVAEILDQLTQIRQVGVLYPAKDGKKPTLQMTLSRRNERQQALFEALELGRHHQP